jgi:hypothetical protein
MGDIELFACVISRKAPWRLWGVIGGTIVVGFGIGLLARAAGFGIWPVVAGLSLVAGLSALASP